MGYTHYVGFGQIPRGQAALNEAAYKQAVLECQRLVRAWSKKHGGISGYAAHCEPGTYGGLAFNGSRDSGAETFVMREHLNQNEDTWFCKTNRQPYDVLVTACLCILAYRLPGLTVWSDGDSSDWADGLALAQASLRRKVKLPKGVRDVNQVLRHQRQG